MPLHYENSLFLQIASFKKITEQRKNNVRWPQQVVGSNHKMWHYEPEPLYFLPKAP